MVAIDTAGPVIGVAVRVEGVTRVRSARVERGSETRLVPWILELCAESGVRTLDLEGVAVSVGPGAFTGLRVGLGTALGLAVAIGAKIYPAMSLQARACAHSGQVLALLDARKSRVYAARYLDGHLVDGPGDVSPEVAVGWCQGPFLATGEGAIVYRAAVEAGLGSIVDLADDPAVDVLARLGEEALLRGSGVDAVDVHPLYLRDADAKRREISP